MKRIAIYTRVSTDEQTTENQQQVLTAWAQNAGGRIVAVFDDNGISGSVPLPDRPAGQALLQAATRREFDQLAVWSTDRLGRSLADLLNTLMQLHALGIDLFIRTQSLDTSTPAGRAMFQMLGVFAEFEREMIRDRVRAGIRRAQKQGKHCGRPPISEAKEAAILRLRAGGMGIRAIARELKTGVGTVQRTIKGASDET